MTRSFNLKVASTFLVLLGTVLAAHPVNATTLFATTWDLDSEIFTVDSTTGVSTSVGLAGTRLSGLTFSGSTLFGWGQNGSLYTVNQSTGVASLVGASGSNGVEGAIAAHPTNGFLYAADSSANNLVRVTPGTGSGTVVGAFGVGDVSGLTFIGSTLYGLDSSPGGLVTVDILSGTATLVGSLGTAVGGTSSSSVGGLVYDGTDLLMLDFNRLLSVNIGTGAATLVTNLSGGIADRTIGGVAAQVAARVPEPTTLLLLGVSLAGLGFARKRLH